MNLGTRKRREKLAMNKEQRSISTLIKHLDRFVSRYVRTKAADKNGVIRCYTCQHPMTINTAQCGHYISRWYKATRWELDNLRPQCMMCNMWKRGDIPTFRENLVKEIGGNRVVELETMRYKVFKKDASWYEGEIERFQDLLSNL